MPPPPPAGIGSERVGPAVIFGHRMPLGALALLLSFCSASDALRVCSRVCTSFQAAALHSSAWPRLKMRSAAAEHSVDSLCYILMSTCAGLQELSLDLTFQQANLGVALPAELLLKQLRTLELKLGDPEANDLACDLLACVESKLKVLKLVAHLTPQLLNAVRMALLSADTLNSLSLMAAEKPVEVIIDTSTVLALQVPDYLLQGILDAISFFCFSAHHPVVQIALQLRKCWKPPHPLQA